jgi:hypothetical protein
MKSTTLPAARHRVGRIRRARGLHHSSRAYAVAARPALLLAAAASGALAINLLGGAPAPAGTDRPVSVASQLALTSSTTAPSLESLRPLQALTASRAVRGDADGPAALTAAAGDQKTLQVLAQAADSQAQILAQQQAEAAAKAAAEAAAKAAADEAAKAAAATPQSFQDYALQKLGGDQGQMSCLQNLWGKESGWNPNAHNPSSTAYGIPQFLDSTWASTGIAKTSDGFRQIDAGLVYIDSRYGSPCGAWAHSRADNWY